MEVIEHIAAITVALAVALVFALMAWTGGHQS
jgi:hypothetical protein